MNDPARSSTAWQQWLIDWVAQELKLAPHEIRSDENLLNYGMDSVNAIMLVGDLEDRLGSKLPPTLVWDFPTIAGLAGKLVEVGGAAEAAAAEAKPAAGAATLDPAAAQELLARLDELSDAEVAALLEQLQRG